MENIEALVKELQSEFSDGFAIGIDNIEVTELIYMEDDTVKCDYFESTDKLNSFLENNTQIQVLEILEH